MKIAYSLTAMSISSTEDIPVDKIIGFDVFAIDFISSKSVTWKEDIL